MEKHLGGKVTEVFEAVRREGDLLYKRDETKFKLTENTLVKSLLPAVDGKGASTDSVLNDFSDFDKKIFIVRDPRDRWISAFFYRWFHQHKPDKKEFERAHRLTVYKEQHPSELPFYALFSMNATRNASWANRQEELHQKVLTFLDKAKEQNWHVIKYEDLMDGKVEELEAYLGFQINHSHSSDQRFSHVARSKKHGNWRRWFNADDVEFYKPVFTEYLEKNGYDASDWDLTKVDSLPASEGSEYMKKLFHGHHAKKRSGIKKWFGK